MKQAKSAKNNLPRIAFLIDPVASFNPLAETTFFIMAEMNRRGWEVWGVELKDLYYKGGEVRGLGKCLKVKKTGARFGYTVLATTDVDLSCMDAVFLRKDPPVDLNFIDHLSLMELLRERTLLVNDPTNVKSANEKIYPLLYPDLIPETLVSQRKSILRDFVVEHGFAVVKPLNLSGGRGVVKVSAKDPSLASLLDIMTDNESRYVMAQRFLPEVARGDKRVLILDGEILGGFLRVPHKSDFRGNLHSGAKLTKTTITKADRDIVERLSPELSRLGLYFVGIDLIGRYVTEVNVTSPMGLGEINHLTGAQSEKTVVDWLQNKLSK